MSWIDENRKLVQKTLVARRKWKYFSPIVLAQYQVTLPLLLQHSRGNLLDVGCGSMPFRTDILPSVSRYDGLDLHRSSDQLQMICDAQYICVCDNSYETVICLEVLEHTPDPLQVLSEIYRVLKPGGTCVLSVPHLSRIHDAPGDYYRFTRFGIEFLLNTAGFQVETQIHKGGLFSFIGHQFSTVFLSLFVKVPIINCIAFFTNQVLVSQFCLWLDRIIDRNGVFACGYALVARKNTV